MRHAIALVVGIVLLLCPVVVAAEVVEIDRTAAVTPDPETGQSTLRFSLWFRYEPAPILATYSTTWTVSEVASGVESVLQMETRPEREFDGETQFITPSPRVLVEAGKAYRAHLTIDDPKNRVHAEYTFDYIAPMLLPIEIPLWDADGDGRIDVETMTDANLASLVVLHAFFISQTTLEAEDVDLGELLAGSAGVSMGYPFVVFTIPVTGIQFSIRTSSGVSVRVAESLALLPAASAAETAGLYGQMSLFDRAYTGRVFTSSSAESPFAARTLFVESVVWEILEAAAEEAARRASG